MPAKIHLRAFAFKAVKRHIECRHDIGLLERKACAQHRKLQRFVAEAAAHHINNIRLAVLYDILKGQYAVRQIQKLRHFVYHFVKPVFYCIKVFGRVGLRLYKIRVFHAVNIA